MRASRNLAGLRLLSDLGHYFRVFSDHTGHRLVLLVLAMIFNGLTETVGISLFIPLLDAAQIGRASGDQLTTLVYGLLRFVGVTPGFSTVLLLILGAFSLKAAVAFGQSFVTAHITARLTRDLRNKFVLACAKMDYRYYVNLSTGFLNNIISTEIERAIATFGHFSHLVAVLIYAAIFAGTSFLLNWRVSLLALGCGLVVGAAFGFVGILCRRYSLLTSEGNASLQGSMIQFIQHFKYLKATDRLGRLALRLERQVEELSRYLFRLDLMTGMFRASMEPLGVLLVGGLLFYEVTVRGRSVAEVLVVALLLFRLVPKIISLQYLWQKFNQTVGGWETFARAHSDLVSNAERGGTGRVERLERAIELEDVTVCFDGLPVLSRVWLRVPKRSVVAILGESGAGKTTIINLITGLLRPDHGRVCIDGKDYGTLDLASLRRLMGYVSQEPVVFHDTIANNISLWTCDETNPVCLERIERAGRDAQCDPFVRARSLGYHAVIGDRGVKLSGGERQRLAIARELFGDPEILIFDEATSLLDSEAERRIQESVESLRGTKTIIIVAHRLSTVRNCDYVYFLDGGQVVEQGEARALYDREGSRFRRMCELQRL